MKLTTALILALSFFSENEAAQDLKGKSKKMARAKSGKRHKSKAKSLKGKAAKSIKNEENIPKKCPLYSGSERTLTTNLNGGEGMNFNRISTFPICTQIDETCNDDTRTNAEIVTVTEDGMTLIYSDAKSNNIGFVDITDPHDPMPAGVVNVEGEPTSVEVLGNYAIAVVNTSEDFINTSGLLVAIDIATRSIVKTWDLGGQPDAIAISPDGQYVVVVIENERDEDLGDGLPPQLPPGYVVVVETADDFDDWTSSIVSLTGLNGVDFPEDPEPESVSISENNIAAVTLQENNAIVLIDLPTKTVVSSFSAGTVDLFNIDTIEDGIIDMTSSLLDVPREPDGVAFIDSNHFATADEGSINGGSRSFTIFDVCGDVVYNTGSDMDHIAASVGHYPESRSENAGIEPENVLFGTFNGIDYLFVNAQRSSLVFVYDVSDLSNPKFKQVLPTGVAPEGAKAIPSRNLLVVANEYDRRSDKIRSTITIYKYAKWEPQYPTLISKTDNKSGVPIPFGALSGLSNDPSRENILYAIEDSFYNVNRFFKISTRESPAVIKKATTIKDTYGVFAAFPTPNGEFTAEDLAAMINDDNTVNINGEGIAADGKGNFYIASEGSGTVGDPDRPIEKLNFIFKVDEDGIILQVISLPDELNAIQLRYGLEGITYVDGAEPGQSFIVVCLQRAWEGYDNPLIGVYSLQDDEWIGSVQYPLDEPESQDGGWVGLSDITYQGEGNFYILERDNKSNLDAAIKRIYSINLFDYELVDEVVDKELVIDFITENDRVGGLPLEKVEGMAKNKKGLWIVNDNDGVDFNSGETQLMNLGDDF